MILEERLVIPEGAVVVFDLDDTLYPEIDFLRSGFRVVAGLVRAGEAGSVYRELLAVYERGGNPFREITERRGLTATVEELLAVYRGHMPEIRLGKEVQEFLAQLKKNGYTTGLLTDGRSVTQRNKLKALGLAGYFDEVVISEEFGSEKPAPENYLYFSRKYQDRPYYYIGNSFLKDFITPNRLGWTTVGLADVENNHIKKQDHTLEQIFLPQFLIRSFACLQAGGG